MLTRYLVAVAATFSIATPSIAQLPKKIPLDPHTRIEDKIYSRKDGVALTMDIFVPEKKRNGAGVIMCISARYESGKPMLDKMLDYATGAFLNRGYVVFMVTHGSQPRFTVPEIEEDIHRAVRFIKANAKSFKVDPNRLGITGASSGGQLCLMIGCASKGGNPQSSDSVERESSSVAAVACVFPVTDFRAFEKTPPDGFDPTVLFPYREIDPSTRKYEIVSSKRRYEIGVACSPLLCVRKDKNVAPTLIVHGDADELVPIKQSRDLDAAFKECGATCELVEVPGMGHSVFEALHQLPKLADWFDKQLIKK